MNLLKLIATLGLDTSEYKEGLRDSADRAHRFGPALGNALAGGIKAVAKGATVAISTVGTAVTALSTLAVKSYADYEQLTGGVETLFKDSADQVMQYASQAYKTAGMSANDYMETATGFAASLVQSLGGDTETAAHMANMAIVDMADNANKMGSDLTSIQTAYAGFSKQNFTMLDNLKLGYGGTKDEMGRLLRDAEELEGYMKGTFDINNFADIVEAIDIIQTELGISGLDAQTAAEMVKAGALTQEEAYKRMGTTAKEAATTISGSIFMMKASWSNLVTGIADDSADMDTLMDNFVESVETVGDNLLPRIEIVLDGVADLIDRFAPVLMEKVPPLIARLIPVAIRGTASLIKSLAAALPELLRTLWEAIRSTLPELVSTARELIGGMHDGFVQGFPALLSQAVDLVSQLADKLVEHADEILDAAVELIETLADGFVQNFPRIMEVAVDLILRLAEKLTDPDRLSELIDAAVDILLALANGLIDNIGLLLDKAPEIIGDLIDALLEGDNLDKIISGAIDILLALTNGMIDNLDKLVDGATQVAEKIANTILEYDWGSVSKKIFQAIADFGHHFGLPGIVTNEEITAITENPEGYEYDYDTGHWSPKKETPTGSGSSSWFGDAIIHINGIGKNADEVAAEVGTHLQHQMNRRRATVE